MARKPSRRAGRYCIRLSRVLTSAVSWPMLRLARLARDLFRCRPDRFHRVQLVCVRREPEDRQPGPGGDQLAHRAADVGVQVVPHHHERAAELLVRGVQEPGVVRLGEALALVSPRRRPGAPGRSAGAGSRA